MSNQEQAGKPLVLPARTSKLVDDFLADTALARQILAACGSPVNIVIPQAVADNAKSFQGVLSAHNLKGALYFAHKANQ